MAHSVPGYGTSVIRDLIPYELGGTVDHVLAADGVRCKLEIPAKWLRRRTSQRDAFARPGACKVELIFRYMFDEKLPCSVPCGKASAPCCVRQGRKARREAKRAAIRAELAHFK